MTRRTQYTETEAFLLALEELAVDSGNTEILDAYLCEHFLQGELIQLEQAAYLLADRAEMARARVNVGHEHE